MLRVSAIGRGLQPYAAIARVRGAFGGRASSVCRATRAARRITAVAAASGRCCNCSGGRAVSRRNCGRYSATQV